MNHADSDIAWAEDDDSAAVQLLRSVTPSASAFLLQKSLGLTYWAYDPDLEEFAWLEKKQQGAPGFDEKKADIKAILAKYDREDANKLLAAIGQAMADGISDKYRITMQVDTVQPTVFSMSCARSDVGGKVLALGLMRNCEKDMKNEMYVLGIRDLLSDFCAATPSAVLFVDNDGAIREMNDRFTSLFGIADPATLVGADIRFEEKTLGKTLVAKVSDALRSLAQFQGRANFLMKDGAVAELSYRIFHFRFRGQMGGIAFAAEEIVEEDAAPQASPLDSIQTPILEVDRKTRMISFANVAARKDFGIEPRHIETERLSDLLISSEEADLLETMLKTKGAEPGRVVTVTTYDRQSGSFIMRARPDQTKPKTHALITFEPAGTAGALAAKVRKLIGALD
mgnify:CR=1 FL=1